MCEQSKDIDWDEIEDGLIKKWYFISKVMCRNIGKQYPYFTFNGLAEQIREDPNFKKEGED